MPTIAGFSTATVLAAVGTAAAVATTANSLANQAGPIKALQPKPAPQAGQAPGAQGVLAGIQNNGGAPSAGPGGGTASTFLSGMGGVDPSALSLGRNALLGL